MPVKEEVDAEKKRVVVSAVSTIKRAWLLDRLLKFSSFNTTLRVLVYVIRFVDSVKQKAGVEIQPGSGPLSVAEIEGAEKEFFRWIQWSCFSGVGDKRLSGMGAFVDKDGIIRIKSHLLFGEEEFGVRCPIVLPHEHEMVKRIIRTEHFRRDHAGIRIMKSVLRERFWILHGHRTINGVLRKCAVCKRFTAQRCAVQSAPLPFDRIKDTVAFDATGVDLAGPLTLRGGQKAWIVLFTCGVYRAIHLELVTTLSTRGFMLALQRFVARRGRPSTIYSDNGLNFVGASNAFKKIDWEEVTPYAAVDRIKWKFNPPTAAWWGGWWERLVGLVKQLLRRILGKKSVDNEELVTILCDVESTLNLRPLTFMSDEKDDLRPLCPAYFLRDNAKSFLPEAEIVDEKELKVRAKVCAALREKLRVRFRKEYLGQLLKVGDVVIIEDDNKKRLEWSLGLVVEVFPGRDGNVRAALVKTKDGVFTRPVQRLFLMEMAEAEEDSVEMDVDEENVDNTIPQVVETVGGATQEVEVETVGKHQQSEDEPKMSRYGRKYKKPQ